jgi:superfamily II DNA or RNA helicase
MNSLDELYLLPVYSSNDDIEKFYNDTLSRATLYQRVSAYFDSKLFKYISKGILGLLKNKGKMQLILSTELNNQIIEQIKNGYNERELTSRILCSLSFDENEDFLDKINDLSFLISIGILDVKIAIKEVGILHEKYGLIHDSENNIILFSGSNNETEAAIHHNYESFETTLSWDDSKWSQSKIKIRESAFNNLWNNQVDNLIVIDASDFVLSEFKNLIDEVVIPRKSGKVLVLDFSDNFLVLKSNFDIYPTINRFQFKSIRSVIKKESDNLNQIRITANIEDIITIKNLFDKYEELFSYSFFVSKKMQQYIDDKYLDLDDLSRLGRQIKSSSIIKDKEFINFNNILDDILKRPLREVQAVSAYHIVKLKKVMNFSVPGSGKTATILGAFEYLRHFNEIDQLFVVGPINCFKSWREEYLEVIKKSTKYEVLNLHNTEGRIDKLYYLSKDFKKAKIILINFESIGSISDNLVNLITKKTMIVFDEVHRIKNPRGVYYSFAKKLVKQAKYKVALTGTPLPNGYEDLHNIFELLYQEYSKTYFGFTQDKLKEVMSKYKELGIEDKNISNLIFPFYTRVSKRDLGIKAPEPDKIIYVDTNHVENASYISIFENKNISSLEKIIRLMRIGSGNDSVNKDLMQIYQGTKEDEAKDTIMIELPSKLAKALDIIVDLVLKGHNVLVWAVFIKTIDTMEYHLSQRLGNRIVGKIYGSIDNRDEIINDFNNIKGNIKVLITNPHTLAESVSLHKNCHHAVYLELNYNLSQYLQSRDRIHRLGISENQETYYYIMINNYSIPSIDFRVYESLGKKAELMYSAIESGQFMSKFSVLDDMDDLLKK